MLGYSIVFGWFLVGGALFCVLVIIIFMILHLVRGNRIDISKNSNKDYEQIVNSMSWT